MLVKPVIQNSGIRKVCSFNLDTPKLKGLSVNVREYEDGFCRYITEIKNKQNKLLGKEIFSLFDNEHEITGLDIVVAPEYRNRNYNIGEILRLVSIIEMLENKINALKIYSKDSAIYFHSKYKFIPNIRNFKERNYALESIIGNNSTHTNLSNAKIIANQMMRKIRSNTSAAFQRDMCHNSNELIRYYIENVLKLKNKEYKNYPFKRGFDMILTRFDIIKNRKMFNDLFKKHGIDYEI